MQWRANVKSRGRALLMLFLFSDVGADDAPTRIRVGSHKAIARQLLPRGEQGMTLAELAAGNFADTESCDEVLATGAAGNGLSVPSLPGARRAAASRQESRVSWPSRRCCRRGEFDPALPPSPVQIAIRKACGLKF